VREDLLDRDGVLGIIHNRATNARREPIMSTDVSLFDLSPSEKLQLVQDLWDDLAASPEDVPVHDWQIAEVERRKANLQKNPASGLSWEEVKRRIRSRHGR
jgi:putative addiction module component (TIGR02574 family)